MEDKLARLAQKLRPDLETLSGQPRLGGVADVITLLYMIPLAVAGLIWLVIVSDWQVLRQWWGILFLSLVLMYLFNRFSFFLITEIRSGGYANSQGALDDMVQWSAILLVGPTAIWLELFSALAGLFSGLRRINTVGGRWNQVRIFTANLASNVLSALMALQIYRWLGGEIPLNGLSLRTLLIGLAAMAVQVVFRLILYGGYIGYVLWGLKTALGADPRPALFFFLYAFLLPALANPFAILAAGLYIREGLFAYLFDMVGLLLVALLARRLSQAAEVSRQQARQLERLEQLGRAILNAPPDASTLPELLREHIPNMFAARGVAIWLKPNRLLLSDPQNWSAPLSVIWEWLHTQSEGASFLADEQLPWEKERSSHAPLVVTPILNVETGHPFGMVYLELQTLAIPWTKQALLAIVPAVQSLSAQVASALHQARVYQESLEMQKTLQELRLARQIQASFLPQGVPHLAGWQLAATLEPARQISGDFYDFINLPEGRLGILIADVADKGLGPALYMALSRTLMRSYAEQYPDDPAAVLEASNRRILSDARANLFVTVFYGVLDPSTGCLVYANAGHTPPYLLHPGAEGAEVQTLRNTGMPLGIDEYGTWKRETVEIQPGDVLLLYTDGVTDAQNTQGEFIDRRFIVEIGSQNLGRPVHELQDAILAAVHHFVGAAPRFDDLTMVILGRER